MLIFQLGTKWPKSRRIIRDFCKFNKPDCCLFERMAFSLPSYSPYSTLSLSLSPLLLLFSLLFLAFTAFLASLLCLHPYSLNFNDYQLMLLYLRQLGLWWEHSMNIHREMIEVSWLSRTRENNASFGHWVLSLGGWLIYCLVLKMYHCTCGKNLCSLQDSVIYAGILLSESQKSSLTKQFKCTVLPVHKGYLYSHTDFKEMMCLFSSSSDIQKAV